MSLFARIISQILFFISYFLLSVYEVDMSVVMIHNFPVGLSVDAVFRSFKDCGNILSLMKVSSDSFKILFDNTESAKMAVRISNQKSYQETGLR